ncbi:hypothetical protein T03_4297 [Trichinella britovi]|uniref:Reverse transcriptase domain-containing protein n=1 Tax=Trichinella britovi TaxID=45882 RepID=A0A0V1DG76_TRIBR|nr:hypothetical protein T03_4297 [Trichinella britovi]
MSKVKLLSLPKKLDLGKRRLIKLLDELDQLLEERAALREIEEQLRTSEEHYRQVADSQEEFETTLNDDEANSVMDEWAKFRQTFRQSKAKAQTLIDELRAVDVVPGSKRSAEAYRNESMLAHFRLNPLSGGPRKLIEARTTKTLCDDIFQPRISARGWPHLRDLGLADEEEEDLTVHVVIGVDYFFRMLGSTIVRAGDDVPVAVETCLRWVICGPQTPSQLPTPTVPSDKSADTECYQLPRKFWEHEAIGISSEEEQSLSGLEREEFERNISFNGVRLVQWKLKRDRKRWREYAAVIQSYLDNGWAEEAPDARPLGRTWYLPHHAVYQKGSSGEVKRYRICLQADIQKMYLQVALHKADRDVCRFLWSEPGENEPPKTYRLTRVCFGLTCSPNLAMQTIRWHAENHQVECSGALSDLLPNMYVDDLVVSCDSVADARRIAKEAPELLRKGGFHLAKWASNSPPAVDEIPAKDLGPRDGSRLWKTLGIFWQRQCDLLTFHTPERVAEFPDTKRGVLKALASVFDPLCCLAPYTVNAKIIIQLLWQCGVAWDDPLPPETKSQWRPWKEELPDISRIVMEAPLVQVPLTTITRLQLHGFAYASGKAYGTVVYLRLTHSDGRVETRLVAAKSRVKISEGFITRSVRSLILVEPAESS